MPAEIKRTFDRLGIPEAEKKYLAGVGAQYESESVYHNLKEEWEKLGVIFLDTDSALKQHPDLFKEYFGTVVPPEDNKLAALNSAVWSGGSFVYVPAGVKVDNPLQAYFRINAEKAGQFERTMKGFAERYDLSFYPFGVHDPLVVDFFRQLFAQKDIHTVLDCACGTGRHLPVFHSLGCKVFGSDISHSMLAQAQSNLAKFGLDVPLHQADFRDLPSHFQQSFDAVVCLGAIGFMNGEVEFLRAFESMGQVLRPGGILILTAIPTDRQWKEKQRFSLNSNSPDFSRLFVIDYLEDKARYNILDIYHSQEKNELKVWSAELHVLLRDDQKRLLEQAGFRKVDFFGAFDFSPYDKETSTSLITVARK